MCNMNDNIENLIKYVEKILGETVFVKDLDNVTASNIPIHITGCYALYSLTILGKELILMFNNEEEEFAPDQIRKQKELVENRTGMIVVFAFKSVASYNLQRLITRRINFIIPEKQMFIPDMLMDLRPIKGKNNNDGVIPAVAQCMVLYHLQVENIDGRTTEELAELFDVSYPNVNRAVKWLKGHGYITLNGGKQKRIYFNYEKKQLWVNIEKELTSPVSRIMYTDERLDNYSVSGINALSDYSMINREHRETYAISKDNFKSLTILMDKNYGFNKIEIWKYDPKSISKTGIVDRLSLYLSLRDNEDERVQMELETMLKNISWYTE